MMTKTCGISMLQVYSFDDFVRSVSTFSIFSFLVDENPDFMQQKKYPNPQTSIARTVEQQRQTGIISVDDNPERMFRLNYFTKDH